MSRTRPLAGARIAITRPAGTAGAIVRQVQNDGGVPLLLPGLSLRGPEDPAAARAVLTAALACNVAIFTSPSAVRFARRLARLHGPATVLAPGTGTLRALQRAGIAHAVTPRREDSEGLLALPALRHVRGQCVAIVGAAGGRGLLDRELARRGARVLHAHVYRRLPARLDRRHADALQRESRKPLYVLLSSSAALANILMALPDPARAVVLAGTAIASSDRLAKAARDAGFARVLRASSAHAGDMLRTIAEDQAHAGSLLALRHD